MPLILGFILALAWVGRAQGQAPDIGAFELAITPAINLVLAISCDNNLTDRSPQNNNGTLQNGATYDVAGKYNQACKFDGVDDLVQVANSASLNFTAGFTLSAWIKPAATPTGLQGIIVKGDYKYYSYSSSDGFCGTGVPLGGFIGTTGEKDVCYSTAFTTAWSYASVTFDGSTLWYYKDGSLVTKEPASGLLLTDTSPLLIGGSIYGEFFNGLIDDIRIYDGAIAVGTPGAECITAPTINRDMICPIEPITAPSAATGLKVGSAGSFKIGAGGGFKVGQ